MEDLFVPYPSSKATWVRLFYSFWAVTVQNLINVLISNEPGKISIWNLINFPVCFRGLSQYESCDSNILNFSIEYILSVHVHGSQFKVIFQRSDIFVCIHAYHDQWLYGISVLVWWRMSCGFTHNVRLLWLW